MALELQVGETELWNYYRIDKVFKKEILIPNDGTENLINEFCVVVDKYVDADARVENPDNKETKVFKSSTSPSSISGAYTYLKGLEDFENSRDA